MLIKKKIYTSAPLPFMGQKRKFLKQFKPALANYLPPYLSTDVSTYKNCWKLKDYLDVLQVLDGTKYFYFTSNKSSIIELCEWIETKTPMSNPFTGASIETMNATVNYSASYTDIMMYKYE